ncbi:MAG: NADH-quinone oxidoreductase subunit J, partial [Planctomycetota bacterium]
FVIMLLDQRDGGKDGSGDVNLPRMPAVGIAAAALFLVAMIAVVSASKPFFDMPMADLIAQTTALAKDPKLGTSGSVGALGFPLFSEWLLPFEVTSVLLLAAIVGAVALTKRKL